MKTSQRKLRAIGLGLLFWNSLLHAQYAETNGDDIRAAVTGISQRGVASNFGFDVTLGLAGDPLLKATKMSLPRVLRAIDDTGANLIPARSGLSSRKESPQAFNVQFSQRIHLQSPGPNATAIKELVVEFDLLSPIEETPIITNFPMQPGGVITHPELDRHHIKLTLLPHPPNHGATAPKNIWNLK
jgi:hypothetical protein